jgi:hypothetical protein
MIAFCPKKANRSDTNANLIKPSTILWSFLTISRKFARTLPHELTGSVVATNMFVKTDPRDEMRFSRSFNGAVLLLVLPQEVALSRPVGAPGHRPSISDGSAENIPLLKAFDDYMVFADSEMEITVRQLGEEFLRDRDVKHLAGSPN